MEKRPVIFLAFANDRQSGNRYLRELPNELRNIRNALNILVQNSVIEIVERANASLSDILDVFQDPKYSGRIVTFHFSGHSNSYNLLFESNFGQKQIVDSESFVNILKRQEGLKLIFLNACTTNNHLRFIQNKIPNIITTSTLIKDDIASLFSQRFYKGLGTYKTIKDAFSDAKDEIYCLYSSKQNFRDLYYEDEISNHEDEINISPFVLTTNSDIEWEIPSPITQQILSDEIIEILKTEITQIYYKGLEHNNIWERSGGKLYDFNMSESAKNQWYNAFKWIKSGGNVEYSNLLEIALLDFPNNTILKKI